MYSILLVVLALLAVVSALPSLRVSAPTTVAELDVNKYLGLWYQMYADAIVYSTFEKNSYCATALYGDNKDGTLSVHNYAATGSATGSPYIIDGYAYQPDATQPGQLKVHFDSSDAFPFDAPYWVLELGPVVNNQYEWAIVSDNLSMYLFVLARDVVTYKAKYDTEVLAKLDAYGFKGFSKPIATYQEADCLYEAQVRANKIQKNAEKEKAIALKDAAIAKVSN